MPGRANGHVLASINGIWQFAEVTGRLVEEGWGAELGYPGFRADREGQRIAGFVFSSTELGSKWSELDAFEGPGYRRINVSADLTCGSQVLAQIYAIAD